MIAMSILCIVAFVFLLLSLLAMAASSGDWVPAWVAIGVTGLAFVGLSLALSIVTLVKL